MLLALKQVQLAVGRFDALRSNAKLPEAVANQLPPITWFAVSGHVNGGLRGMVRAETRDDEAANNLRDVVRGFLALAKMQAGSRPEFQTLAQSLELGGTGKTVALSFDIPAQIFDAFAPKERRIIAQGESPGNASVNESQPRRGDTSGSSCRPFGDTGSVRGPVPGVPQSLHPWLLPVTPSGSQGPGFA